MNKYLVYSIFIYFIGCSAPECFEVLNKYDGDGTYYFEWEGSDSLFANPSTLVGLEDYNQYEVGDTYCVN
jgi:hypothetical protein